LDVNDSSNILSSGKDILMQTTHGKQLTMYTRPH
jgi:hypothetical protein